MFGYVRPLKGELKVSEYERFHAAYCGLCFALGKRYGWFARFLLNYDLAFFAAATCGVSGEADVMHRRCAANPFKRRCTLSCTPAVALAADLNVILAYMKLDDDARDDGGIKNRLLRWWTRRYYKKAAAHRPQLAVRVGEALAALNTLERERSQSIDRLADAFASILRSAAEECGSNALGELLYHIGRFVYIIDAADDLESDRKTGSFNAVDARFGSRDDEELKTTLGLSLEAAYKVYETIDFGLYGGFVENVILLGLPAVMNEVLSGRFKQRRRHHRPL